MNSTSPTASHGAGVPRLACPASPFARLLAALFCVAILWAQTPPAAPIPEGDEFNLWFDQVEITDTEVRLAISFHADAQHNYVVEYSHDVQPLAPCDAWRPVAFAPHNYGIVFLTNQMTTPSRLYRLRRIEQPFTGLHALLFNDTGDNALDGLTSDPTISGLVVPSQPGLELQASLDAPDGPFKTLQPVPRRQHFRIERGQLDVIASGLLNDGAHVLHVRTATAAGQPVSTFAVPFQLDTAAPHILLETDPPLGGVGLGEGSTTRENITLLARTEPRLRLELVGTPWAGEAGPDGWLRFENLPLALGANLLRLRALDAACNEGLAELTVTRVSSADCLFADDLQGWHADIAPPLSGHPPGAVAAANCVATLTEGDSFVVALGGAFAAPATPSVLEVQFLGPTFDSTSTQAIKDAFEIAIVDDAGQPLTYVIADGRDACFNLTEGLSAVALAPEVVFTPSALDSQPSSVSISLAHLFPGQTFRLTCRLVNNDGDHDSTVSLVNIQSTAQPGAGLLLVERSKASPAAVIPQPRSDRPAQITRHRAASASGSPTGVSPVTAPTSESPRSLMSADGPLARFQIATNLLVSAGFIAEVFADVDRPLALTYVASGSGFPDGLFVAAGKLSDFSEPIDPSPDRILRVSSWGVASLFATLAPEADPTSIAFPPVGSRYGTFLYLSANNRDGGRVSDWGGSIEKVDSKGTVLDITALGLPDGPGEPSGLAFGPGGGFGDDLFLANGSDHPGKILKVSPVGAITVFLHDGIFWPTYPVGLQPSHLAFGPGGRFGSDLYFAEYDAAGNATNQLRRVSPDSSVSDPFLKLPGSPRGLRFGPGGAWGNWLYVATGNDTNGVILQILPEAVSNEFATGFAGLRGDCLTFGPDAALYVADYEGNRVYRILAQQAPTISIAFPPDHAEFPGGTVLVISGRAHAHRGGDSIISVTVNGRPVEALDSAGNFFTQVTIASGQNRIQFIATDVMAQTAGAQLDLFGLRSETGAIDFSSLSDVSYSLTAEWGRTSFNEDAKILFADLSIRNTGQYPVKTPLLIGITRPSDPSVRVLNADGLTPDGIPYFDFSSLITDPLNTGSLITAHSTGSRTLAFANPRRTQFTFDLVVLGLLNRPPAFTTVPVIEAIVGQPYTYAFEAVDPDADPLTYFLASHPSGLTLNPQPRTLNWSPAEGDLGTHNIRLRVEDGHGGWAEQSFVLSVAEPPPNRPPFFVSAPVVHVGLAGSYAYDADALDPDNDTLT